MYKRQVQCLGEDAGWRGYLLPKLLEFMKPWKAVLLTGVIWGLWHAPVIACGFNYGTAHPIAGIFAMVVFSTCLLYTSNYNGGSLSCFRLAEDGSLSEMYWQLVHQFGEKENRDGRDRLRNPCLLYTSRCV